MTLCGPEGNPPEAIEDRLAKDLSITFTRLLEEDAVQLAWKIYGIHGRATRFATEKDDTFRIDAVNGSRHVMKVSNPRERLEELALQVAVMNHVREVSPGLPVARVVESLDGRYIVPISMTTGEGRTVRLYTYLEGIPLDAVRTNAQNRFEIGETLAKLQLATASFHHPSEHRVLAWDVKHMLALSGLRHHVEDSHHRALIDEAFERFEKIVPALLRCPTQVVHNDFNRSNIVTNPNGPQFMGGIIDFGDVVHTAVAIDVATAVMNQFPSDFNASGDSDLFDEPRDLLRGYLAHAPLSKEELHLIPHLAMARVAVRAMVTSWRATLFPENAAYILRFTRPGWEHLEWLMQHDHETLSNALIVPSVHQALRIAV